MTGGAEHDQGHEEPETLAGQDESTAPGGEATEGIAPPVEGSAAWLRLLRMGHPRLTKANVLSGALALLLGIGIATQVQLTNSRGLEDLSQTDLVRVLDDVSVRAS
jgi:hypothetical protein